MTSQNISSIYRSSTSTLELSKKLTNAGFMPDAFVATYSDYIKNAITSSDQGSSALQLKRWRYIRRCYFDNKPDQPSIQTIDSFCKSLQFSIEETVTFGMKSKVDIVNEEGLSDWDEVSAEEAEENEIKLVEASSSDSQPDSFSSSFSQEWDMMSDYSSSSSFSDAPLAPSEIPFAGQAGAVKHNWDIEEKTKEVLAGKVMTDLAQAPQKTFSTALKIAGQGAKASVALTATTNAINLVSSGMGLAIDARRKYAKDGVQKKMNAVVNLINSELVETRGGATCLKMPVELYNEMGIKAFTLQVALGYLLGKWEGYSLANKISTGVKIAKVGLAATAIVGMFTGGVLLPVALLFGTLISIYSGITLYTKYVNNRLARDYYKQWAIILSSLIVNSVPTINNADSISQGASKSLGDSYGALLPIFQELNRRKLLERSSQALNAFTTINFSALARQRQSRSSALYTNLQDSELGDLMMVREPGEAFTAQELRRESSAGLLDCLNFSFNGFSMLDPRPEQLRRFFRPKGFSLTSGSKATFGDWARAEIASFIFYGLLRDRKESVNKLARKFALALFQQDENPLMASQGSISNFLRKKSGVYKGRLLEEEQCCGQALNVGVYGLYKKLSSFKRS